MRGISTYLWQVQLFNATKCSYFLHNKTLLYLTMKRNMYLWSLNCSNSDFNIHKPFSIQNSSKIFKNYYIFSNAMSKFLKRELSDTHEISPSSGSTLNVGQVLELCESKLQKEISEAELDSEYIISRALNINRIDLHLHKNEDVSPEALSQINDMMRCRLARMPIQYILGDWDFHSITLKVRPPVFIPRPETEDLVNLSVQELSEAKVKNPFVLDIGCGSGAISLALLNLVPELTCVALDQSKYAVELTEENARDLRLSNRLHVVKGKVTEEAFPVLPFDKYDLIVSNPPYVLKDDMKELQPEILLYEDMRALYGGEEKGMNVIINIILHGQHLLKDKGHIILETDPKHFYSLPKWLEKNETTLEICEFYKDFSGMQRYIKLKKKTKD